MIIATLSDVVPGPASMAPSYENFAESEPRKVINYQARFLAGRLSDLVDIESKASRGEADEQHQQVLRRKRHFRLSPT